MEDTEVDEELKAKKAWVFQYLQENFDGHEVVGRDFEAYVKENYDFLREKERRLKQGEGKKLPEWMKEEESNESSADESSS